MTNNATITTTIDPIINAGLNDTKFIDVPLGAAVGLDEGCETVGKLKA